jgi:hypothetical protein
MKLLLSDLVLSNSGEQVAALFIAQVERKRLHLRAVTLLQDNTDTISQLLPFC